MLDARVQGDHLQTAAIFAAGRPPALQHAVRSQIAGDVLDLLAQPPDQDTGVPVGGPESLGAGGGVDSDDGDRPSDRLFHHLGWGEQVVVEILLDDADVVITQRIRSGANSFNGT